MRLLVLCPLLAGCDTVFIDPPPDPIVRGTLLRRSVEGTQPTSVALAPEDVILSARFEDGSSTSVSYLPSGEFEFHLPRSEASYQLAIEIDGRVTELQHDATELALVRRTYERTSRAMPTQPTRIELPEAGAVPMFVTTGTWTLSHVDPTQRALDWSRMRTATGEAAALLSSTDRGYLLERDFNASYVIKRVLEIPIEMIDGGTTAITQPLVPVTPNACAMVNGHRVAAANRLRAAITDHDVFGANWIIGGAPDLDTGTSVIHLAGDNVLPDEELDTGPVLFHNPIPGLAFTASMFVAASREYVVGDALPTVVYSGVTAIDHLEIFANCSSSSVLLDVPVAIPTKFAVAGVALDADNVVVPLGSRTSIDITWGETEGDVTDYAVTISEVYADGATKFRPIRSVTTVNPRAVFDRAFFQPGKTYLARVEARTGTPNAAAGDFAAVEYPRSSAAIHTKLFRVAP